MEEMEKNASELCTQENETIETRYANKNDCCSSNVAHFELFLKPFYHSKFNSSSFLAGFKNVFLLRILNLDFKYESQKKFFRIRR